jgi:hypothetical protein
MSASGMRNWVKIYLAAVCWTFLLSGCGSSSKTEDSEPVLLSQGNVVENSFGTCDTIANNGASVGISLWQPADSGKAAAVIHRALSEKSIQLINSYADSASIAANPAALQSVKGAFEVFRKNYLDFKKDVPDAPGCWQIELKGDTVMVTPKTLLYQLDHYAFTGGAHPNSFRSYHIFDAKSGTEKEMREFVADSIALLALVEKKFREVEKLTDTDDLEKAGYFLANHQFFMPANYVFTRTGVLFYYNPYEIAAYVRGPIEFTIPYSELADLVKREDIF